jgi:hypothetical protein
MNPRVEQTSARVVTDVLGSQARVRRGPHGSTAPKLVDFDHIVRTRLDFDLDRGTVLREQEFSTFGNTVDLPVVVLANHKVGT